RGLSCPGRADRGHSVRRSLNVNHQPSRPAELQHAEAGGCFETDAVADDPLEVADVGDFANLRQPWLEIAGNAAGDVAVPKHGADAGRAFRRDGLAARVADKR